MLNIKLSLWKSKTGYTSLYGISYKFKFELKENMEKEEIMRDYDEIELTKNNFIEAILHMQDVVDYTRTELKAMTKHELYNLAQKRL